MNKQPIHIAADAMHRMQTEAAVKSMILAIRERTPATVIIHFDQAGAIDTIQVFYAKGFSEEPHGPFRFVQTAREWCASHPVAGVVI